MNTYHQTFMAMGTRLDILLPGMEQERGERISFSLRREAGRLESIYSRYLPESETTRLNMKAQFKPVPVSAELFSMLLQCANWHDYTQGYFDTSRGKPSDFYKGKPSAEPLESSLLAQHSGIQFVELNGADNTVFFKNGAVSLDFGAIGKGIALEHFRRILQREGVANALISFGESSVLAHGTHPYGENWAVGIRKTEEPETMEHVLYLKDQCLSTSGVNRENSSSKKQITGHLLDMQTGEPVNRIGAVSVISSDPVEAEVLSTTLFCAPMAIHEAILSKFKPARVVHTGNWSG